MRLPIGRSFAAALTLLITSLLASIPRALAQLAPAAQTHVAAIGAAPLRATLGSDLTAGGRLTLEGWVYLTSPKPFSWIMGKALATSGVDPFVSYALMFNSEGTRVVFAASTGAAGSYRDLTAPTAFPLNTWTHLAAVADGTASRLFVNGQLVAAGTLAGPVANPVDVPFGLGIAYLANGNTNYTSFDGFARQVRLWSVARTAAQISDANSPILTDRAGLHAHWPLDESSGTTARDVSGNNRPLTGGGNWQRLALLENPFFSLSTVSPAGNVLQFADDGIVFDFDGDGDLDLITTHIHHPPTLPETRLRLRAFRNTAGAFTDVTDVVLGNVTMVHPRHHAIADFNRDGRLDLLIIGHGTDRPPYPGEQAKLFIGTADGRLADETSTRLPQRSDFTHNVAVGDIDGDGDIDIYMANINGDLAITGGPVFYLNNGSGNFTAALDRLPTDIATRERGLVYLSCALVDLNLDGRPDLVLGGADKGPNEVLVNDGTGRFTRNAAFALPPKIISPQAATVAVMPVDLNGDGATDLVLSTTGGQITMPTGEIVLGYSIPGVQLLLNRGNGTFYDASEQLNVTFNATTDTWVEWIRVADLNRDGRPDLVLQGAIGGTGAPFSRTILLNRGGAVFVDASEANVGSNVAYLQPGDYNGDGLIDLLGVTNNRIEVSRALRPLDRSLFQTTADDAGRMTNLSVRTQAGTGDQTLITGFALSGAGTKSLLVRAIGPTLSVFGLTGTLADPFMEIAPLGAANMATNDNWGGTTALKTSFGSVGAFPLSLDNSRDAALVFSPGAGAYTAKVTGVAGGTGLALVEVYDTGTGNTPRLTNVSARTQVGTGGDVLIVGFVVSGNVPKKLLIRAVGPTLGVFGVGGTLVDPVLELRPLGSSNIVATNDDWCGTAALKSAFASVGAFAFAVDASKDAAAAIELPPGAYTATVTGKASTTGVALVEVYELP